MRRVAIDAEHCFVRIIAFPCLVEELEQAGFVESLYNQKLFEVRFVKVITA
jgi:hypothetical protein